MSWISFWIKPEAVPARVTLCVTSLLTLSTQHAQSQKSLPPVSYIKAIDIFMSSCTVFVFASLMEYALVNILMADEVHENHSTHTMSPNSTSIPKSTTGASQPNTVTNPLYTSAKGHSGKPYRSRVTKQHDNAMFADRISRLTFPLSFVILNIIYWAYYLS